MSKHVKTVSPVAQHVIAKCGGPKAVSAITGHSVSSIYKWMYAKEDGGTGGLIPAKAQEALWSAALRKEVSLSASDFVAPLAAE